MVECIIIKCHKPCICMSESDNDDFIIKDDGTIVRGPKLGELKRKLNSKGKNNSERQNQNKNDHNDNNGCVSTLIGFFVFVLITTIIGGVIGFFVDEHDSIEMGLLLGGFIGIAFVICGLIGEFLNRK